MATLLNHRASSCLVSIASRRGPTDIHLTGVRSSSTRSTYACAFLGRWSNVLISEILHHHPGNRS